MGNGWWALVLERVGLEVLWYRMDWSRRLDAILG